ncbi:cytochrome ubiquinol oxidase subunit I [Commensalibacter oyaizuii]|uniref:Cytochrome ubiquinol oxidase subunit I n=1 Tax=Commensalibacter oyaizuii TaxID=3043873 RepID=A0ABT6Q351_9PROT|nr:cytochrome ubiquinol oxidase subunit I [Commensalibacter sp. TBRC 16381]MDI2091530.1 cytochrome ubiquinol oxidase subunit I [Commensalibacter sp. TBRC 16381]
MDLIHPWVVDLSRFQFALTALYHFMFVPLTLGLTFILAAMETVYVVTGKQLYKDMTQFWGKLFGINFALGVATGLTMEFEFGTNWSMYSRFFGDIFGTPLAIEGLMAFFMESTFVGLMFFGWDRLSRPAHLAVTYLVALGSNLSALWILVANASMNMPMGTTFDPETMRMTFDSFVKVVFNPDAQAKFVHTSLAGYVTASMFVMGISAFYLLRRKHRMFAAHSFRIAALFGILSTIAVITLGDVLGRLDYEHQPTKVAAMEGLWHTSKPPAEPWILFAIPDDKNQKNYFEIGVPYVLTPLLTHTFDTPIKGLYEIQDSAGPRIESGLKAVAALKRYSEQRQMEDLAVFKQHEKDLGYGFLASRYAPEQNVDKITSDHMPQIIEKTKLDLFPNVFVTFWSFRFMVFLGVYFFVIFAMASYLSLRNQLEHYPWFLKACTWSIPLPFVAAEFGWITAEIGRQPWTVFDILPTFMSASSHTASYMVFSLIGFVTLYSIFIIAELYLMFKYARLGPQPHHPSDDNKIENISIISSKNN